MKILKKIATFTLALTLLSGMTACGNQPTTNPPQTSAVPSNGTKTNLIMAIGEEPEGGFDPCTGWGRYGSPLFQSTLVETDANMNIVNDLATGYTISPDGLRWVFTLRKDATFTDGKSVTAADIAFTFETAKNSGSVVDLSAMVNCSATDDFTVEFVLTEPQSAFIYTVAATGIVPQHAYSANYGDMPIGSGPFKLLQWDRGQQMIMTANEDYYGKIPALKQVTILFLSEDNAFAAAMAGQLDLAVTTPALAAQQVNGMTLQRFPTIDNRGITLPTQPNGGQTDPQGNPIGNNVTSDLAVRQALSYGLDREALVRDAIGGFGRPAFTECDGMPWWNKETVAEYNPQKAKDILDQAGWLEGKDGVRVKDGVRAAFSLIYPAADSARQAIAMATAQQAEALGIAIVVEGVSWDQIDKRMYSDPVMMGWGAQNPMETYLLYHKNNQGKDYYNPTSYNNTMVDSYIEQAMHALNPEEALTFWQKAQWDGTTGYATQGDCAWVWLVNVDHLYFVRDGLDIGRQKIHPHGHAWPLAANLRDWQWS